ncbi:hypothetical protein FE257_006056 [Aspergillus nanangensis]|uniref:Zn(2)-C6 fungal-type domain-containing protein n=1 Tax=Aspergillus nanangensis TaxID=2582783 RepID=A0AAD4CRC3_ASPNN|nr:hypothetical protein FE257_006056 [Aspergillus nanangensis]
MAESPPVYACHFCRVSKVGCDKSRPRCMRCLRNGHDCHYDAPTQSSNRHRRAPSTKKKKITIDSAPQDQVQAQSQFEQRPTSALLTTKANQTRNRIPKACSPCRQSKVKCDRREPCGRCVKTDKEHECHYPAASPAGNEEQNPSKECIPLWKQKFHTAIHWTVMVENIESLLNHHRWPERYGRHIEHNQLFSPMDNFFGYVGPLQNATRRTLLSYVPPRNVTDCFIEHYLNIIEPSYQLLHVPSFHEEVETFWEKPSTLDDGWLAQLFAILALGCQLHNASIPPGQHMDFEVLPERLYEAAQACLQRTAFMIRPEMASIRTLCLFVIIKQTKRLFCAESDALWPATGLVVRLAVIMGLHSTDPKQGTQSTVPTSVRNALWAAVILLDLRQSLASGMPVIPPSSELIERPLHKTEADQPSDFPFPLMIYDNLPQIFKVLELATSPQITSSYDLVVTYDQQIRELLKHYHRQFLSVEKTNDHSFQWTTVNVFFRRVLLALHSRLYQEPQASTQYPVAYWSSLDCSLALLSEQRGLWDYSSSRAGAAMAPFFARLFRSEFFLAAITVCFYLVQAHSPLDSPNSPRCHGEARRTVLELLTSCKDVWGVEKDASVCHSRAFGMIDSLLQISEDEVEGRVDFEFSF